ncbi:MAG: Pectate lyase superfamily protein [Pedosphaera sp.]|nr:Pectate lyase superfamily protein [Pedosphaera sp.]
MNTRFRFPVLFAFALATSAVAQTSELWGAHGENWDPHGRLPDFSYAGYHCGEAPLPNVPLGVSIKSFGAKGDGVTDDTAAFLKALATIKSGAIEVPAGRYIITNILEVRHSGVVLRGAGPDKTVLFFPIPLQVVKPDDSTTTSGRPTSNYSWLGGFVWFKGELGERELAKVTSEAKRGDTALQVASADNLHIGQRIEIFQTDPADYSLTAHLYSDDSGSTAKIHGNHASLVCRVIKIEGNQIQIDRPLRFDVKAEWQPRLRSFEPTVTESGIENICFEFPNTPYAGHFTEPGFNPLAFNNVSDCWGRNLRITNADSGPFLSGHFCTVQDVVFDSARKPDSVSLCTGHHGTSLEGDDNLFTGFDYHCRFIHDITVSIGAGNVIVGGRGVDLCFDHHKHAPYENLFANIDVGAGTDVWRHGGGDALGKPSGARGTFWNIRSATPLHYPPADFGPPSMNFIALETAQPTQKSATNRWFEAIPTAKIIPQDLHAAQLARRLSLKQN